jgi:hypothetical protein
MRFVRDKMLHRLDSDLQVNGVKYKTKILSTLELSLDPRPWSMDKRSQLSLASLLGTKNYTKVAVAVVMNNEIYV